MYTIEIDDAESLIQATITGFLDDEQLKRYVGDLERALLKTPNGVQYKLLVQMFDSMPFSQASVSILDSFRDGGAFQAIAKTAFVSIGMLQTLQIRRAGMDSMQIFATKEEALAWLGQR